MLMIPVGEPSLNSIGLKSEKDFIAGASRDGILPPKQGLRTYIFFRSGRQFFPVAKNVELSTMMLRCVPFAAVDAYKCPHYGWVSRKHRKEPKSRNRGVAKRSYLLES